MLVGFIALIAFQLVGEAIVAASNLPIPGPVVGMGLLLTALAIRGQAPAGLKHAAQPLLQHMSLLFIPAGAGLMLYMDLIKAEWPALLAVLIVSTFLAMLVTAIIARSLGVRRIEDDA